MKHYIVHVLFLLLNTPCLMADRPNILWLSAEDISPHLGCYGDPHAITPHLDQLAAEGVRFTHAYTTAGVCAPCRSGIITGMYQTTLGTHHMRCEAQLPDHIRPFPEYLRKAGYYCTNNSKTDYQFKVPKTTWDQSNNKAHWRTRLQKQQPFFSVFNFTGCHESGIASTAKYQTVTESLSPDQRQQASQLTTLPPYYPDRPVAREDWKRNYELITALDMWVAEHIRQLKADGLYEETIIFFWSDHGVGLPRAKRWLYESGTHIPLIVRIPEKWRTSSQGTPGSVADQLVSSIDFAPTVLNLCDIEIPDDMQGQPFLGGNLPEPRAYVYGARDRMDERYDIIRMVRGPRYRYIRNYEPLKTYYQYMNTAEQGATMAELRQLHEAGQLSAIAERYFAPTKPVEELYDTENDPHEINNLANDPAAQDILVRMRSAHLEWVKETRDLGLMAEPIIEERERQLGNRFDILAGSGDLSNRIADMAVAASSGMEALQQLQQGLQDPDAAVRYWAAVGLGNLGLQGRVAVADLRQRLKDDASVVRTAAALALCRMQQPDGALEVLGDELEHGAQWERLHAAIALDEIDTLAVPVIEKMRAAMKPREDLYANGKYTVRVINRALNQLEGTAHKVP